MCNFSKKGEGKITTTEFLYLSKKIDGDAQKKVDKNDYNFVSIHEVFLKNKN